MHNLTIATAWARSHRGQDLTGRCDCGGWAQTVGGGQAHYRTQLRNAHAAHVAEATDTEGPA